MEKLYKLAKICEPHRPVLESLISLQKHAKMWDLYDLLYKENQLSNTEANIKVYGIYNAKQFSVLKAKMFGLLIKTVSTLDVGSNLEEDRYNKVIESSRRNLAARIILSNGERGLAIKIFEDLLKKPKTQQISLHAFEQLKILLLHYGATRYNKYKLKKYTELEKEFFQIASAESKAIRYYVELKKIQIQSLAAPGKKEIAKANKYAKRLQAINGVYTRLFLFYRFQVIIKKLEYERQFDEVLTLCDQAEQDFSSAELSSRSSLIIVKQIQLWALIQVGRYDDCIKKGLIEINKQHISPINWYSSVHYTLKAYLYSKKYSLAAELLISCIGSKNFKKLNKLYKEVVNIHLGYIHLIVDSGIAGDPEELQKKLPDFKLGKFLNTVPVFSKDKRGINVSIHLMHIAFLLQRKDYNRIIDRVDSLNQYAYRYLRKDDSFRSNCMIKMVIQMTKADFNPIRTERYTRDLRQQLGTITLAGSGENIEVEMIPFEVLWDIMMRAL